MDMQEALPTVIENTEPEMAQSDRASSSLVGYPVPTREALRQRRQALRHQRRANFWQGSWRFVATTGILTLLAVGIRHPYWQIQDPEQIVIRGHDLLSADQIRRRLDLDLPLNVWHIQPQVLQGSLLATTTLTTDAGEITIGESPLRSASIQRRLIPAGVVIEVQERIPVARATVNGIPGFVDADGIWLSLQHYPGLGEALPELTLVGWEHHAASEWAWLLRGLVASPVAVQRVNWPAGEALKLETELGLVVLGSLGDSLPEQLHVLGQMRDLDDYCQCSPEDIELIDLTSARAPSIQFTDEAAQTRWGS